MVKRLLSVLLAFCLIASAGCAELRQLRKQNASLREQLEASKTQAKAALQDRDALRVEQQRLGAELAAAKTQGKQLEGLVGELQRERLKVEQQRRELQGLVKDLTVERRGNSNAIVMESDILFAPGKVELSDEAKVSLDKIAEYLVQKPDLPVRVDGHTDGVPIRVSGWKDNHHLSVMRAHAVMRYLIEKGVGGERIHIVGYGPNEPRVTPDTPTQDMPENRRVEIILVPAEMRSIDEILEAFQH